MQEVLPLALALKQKYLAYPYSNINSPDSFAYILKEKLSTV
jgi:hypothetical protein